MSELFDKEVNAQKESLKKTSRVHASSRMPTKKCAMKMKQRRSKRRTCKNVFGGRKLLIRRTQRTGENDLNKLPVNDSGHNEGIYHLFSKRVNWCQGDGYSSVGARTAPLNSQWLVLRIGGTDFLHCWLTDSISLERAKSLITKR